jgi:glycosyltransferase involved in cell wall biosynthesis
MGNVNLSVIVPCLNAEATLATQLEALAAQQWSKPWEIIVSDNGSNDNSVEIAHSYEKRFYSLRIIDASARKGPAYARNYGVTEAASDGLAFCDADDEVAPGWVALMGEGLFRHEIVYGRFRFDKFNDPSTAEHMAEQWKDGLYKGRFLPGGGTGNLGVKRRVHNLIGGFDERLPWNEDADYYWRLQLEGFELHYEPEAIVQVRVGRVNPSLHYLYRRGRNRSTANYWSYKKYRHLGMTPPESLGESLLMWLHALSAIARYPQFREKRATLLQQVAQKTGELVGQFKGRINNPCKPYYPAEKSKAQNI